MSGSSRSFDKSYSTDILKQLIQQNVYNSSYGNNIINIHFLPYFRGNNAKP